MLMNREMKYISQSENERKTPRPSECCSKVTYVTEVKGHEVRGVREVRGQGRHLWTATRERLQSKQLPRKDGVTVREVNNPKRRAVQMERKDGRTETRWEGKEKHQETNSPSSVKNHNGDTKEKYKHWGKKKNIRER